MAKLIEDLLLSVNKSIDAALYRLSNPRLAGALRDAMRRGVEVRLILDEGKYEEIGATRELLSRGPFPFRLLNGHQGAASKMHHKFAILDDRAVLTGSYNWTIESDDQNYENLVILRDLDAAAAYRQEFRELWSIARRR